MATAHAEPAHEKANIADVKREISRRRRKNKHDAEVNYLNITAMLDMMTIILVFLLKTMASSASNIPQSDDLRVPRSTSRIDPSSALQVIISRVSVTVNGRSLGIQLRDGNIDPSLKRGGSGQQFYVNPLGAEMREQAELGRALSRRTGQPFRGEVAIIADENIPSRTVFEVLYTCAQNGFSDLQLLVLRQGSR